MSFTASTGWNVVTSRLSQRRAPLMQAEVRHEHRQQHQERHRQQGERIFFQQLQLGAHRHAGREQTEAKEQQVLLQEIERADVLTVRHGDRARGHHHHAHAGQPDQRDQQPQVEAAARSAAAFGLGGGVKHLLAPQAGNREWGIENGTSAQAHERRVAHAFAYSLFPIPYSRLS